MRLTLMNGYPFPYPERIAELRTLNADMAASEEQDEELRALEQAISDAASGNQLIIDGVKHFEWLHTVTVEFDAYGAFDAARRLTGWSEWTGLILEAKLSAEDGYDHPAIVVGDMAYCGFSLTVE